MSSTDEEPRATRHQGIYVRLDAGTRARLDRHAAKKGLPRGVAARHLIADALREESAPS